MKHFAGFAGSRSVLNTLVAGKIRAYHEFAASVLAEATWESRRATLHSIFGCAVKWGLIAENPFDAVPRRRQAVRVRNKMVSREQYAAILDRAGPFWASRIRFIYITGCRVSEACKLKKEDVDRTARQFVFRSPKERRDRIMPISHELEEILTQTMQATPGPYALGRPDGSQLSRHRVYAVIRAADATVGPHGLRHARITHLLEDGADLVSVMGLVGHRQLSTTQGYLHQDMERKRAAMEKGTPITNNLQHQHRK